MENNAHAMHSTQWRKKAKRKKNTPFRRSLRALLSPPEIDMQDMQQHDNFGSIVLLKWFALLVVDFLDRLRGRSYQGYGEASACQPIRRSRCSQRGARHARPARRPTTEVEKDRIPICTLMTSCVIRGDWLNSLPSFFAPRHPHFRVSLMGLRGAWTNFSLECNVINHFSSWRASSSSPVGCTTDCDSSVRHHKSQSLQSRYNSYLMRHATWVVCMLRHDWQRFS